MSAYLLDTHAWAFLLLDSSRIPRGTLETLSEATAICVSPVSVFEIAQKVRIGKWPEAAHLVRDMPTQIGQDGTSEVPLSADICLHAGCMDWPHRDPFDRMLAATAELRELILVTMDPVFGTRPSVRTIW